MVRLEEDLSNVNSIYKVFRKIKRRDQQSLYNSLRSIYEDAKFVGEIRALWPELPLLANLRCGLWYAPFTSFHPTPCYFKSTDGHAANCSFNPNRLNLHVAHLAAQRGGCFIVDATRQGKRFPDSFSRTIPIWSCVLNRAVYEYRKSHENDSKEVVDEGVLGCIDSKEANQRSWDCSLHLPLWVSKNEKENIEKKMDTWVSVLHAANADIASLSRVLKKPIQPLWISQKSVIWLNEVPDAASWAFTPLILVSASQPIGNVQRMTDGECGWSYIPGAGDDEESWARGLTPPLFWKHAVDLIQSSPDECNRMVAEIVERDRVSRAYRGLETKQATVRPMKENGSKCPQEVTSVDIVEVLNVKTRESEQVDPQQEIYRIGDTKLAVANANSGQLNRVVELFDCIIKCGINSGEPACCQPNACLSLQMTNCKHDRFSIQSHLHEAVAYARQRLKQQDTILIICANGEDLSICVCLAILITLFNQEGVFDDGLKFRERTVSKWDIRQRLVYICTFAPNARPSRGNLRQVYNFLLAQTQVQTV